MVTWRRSNAHDEWSAQNACVELPTQEARAILERPWRPQNLLQTSELAHFQYRAILSFGSFTWQCFHRRTSEVMIKGTRLRLSCKNDICLFLYECTRLVATSA